MTFRRVDMSTHIPKGRADKRDFYKCTQRPNPDSQRGEENRVGRRVGVRPQELFTTVSPVLGVSWRKNAASRPDRPGEA